MRDIQPQSGSVHVHGSIAYSSQEAWIPTQTLRETVIMFGNGFDQDWYDRVVDACGLVPDFNSMPSRDMTEVSACMALSVQIVCHISHLQVGERGVTLSGGQKARLSLARAVYSKRDIYLLDDPLSAVDVRVAKHIFQKCIRGLLRDKTVVLVTHQTQFLPQVDSILILQGAGVMAGHGTFDELCSTPALEHMGVLTAHQVPESVTTDIALADKGEEQTALHAAEDTQGSNTSTLVNYIMSAGGVWVAVLAFLCAATVAASVSLIARISLCAPSSCVHVGACRLGDISVGTAQRRC
jgi:ABC-type multidrug transport system ATPase subunit